MKGKLIIPSSHAAYRAPAKEQPMLAKGGGMELFSIRRWATKELHGGGGFDSAKASCNAGKETQHLAHSVWPDCNIICSVFNHKQQWKIAQWHWKIAKAC